MEINIGRHMSKEYVLSNLNLNDYKYNAIQFFVSSPQSSAVPTFDKEYVTHIKKYKKIKFVIHGKYIYNFSWNRDWQDKAFINELDIAIKLDCDIIIHMGKHLKKISVDEAIINYSKNINKILNKRKTKMKNTKILLENSCRQGTEIGYSIKQMKEIYENIKNKDKVGFCLDTCHLFVSGECNFVNLNATIAYFKEFNNEIGLDKVNVIHLNDSLKEFNAHNDEHANFFANESQITSHSTRGIKYVIDIAKKYNIVLILETPNSPDYENEIDKILKL
jgi:deoxyribonuclease-4